MMNPDLQFTIPRLQFMNHCLRYILAYKFRIFAYNFSASIYKF